MSRCPSRVHFQAHWRSGRDPAWLFDPALVTALAWAAVCSGLLVASVLPSEIVSPWHIGAMFVLIIAAAIGSCVIDLVTAPFRAMEDVAGAVPGVTFRGTRSEFARVMRIAKRCKPELRLVSAFPVERQFVGLAILWSTIVIACLIPAVPKLVIALFVVGAAASLFLLGIVHRVEYVIHGSGLTVTEYTLGQATSRHSIALESAKLSFDCVSGWITLHSPGRTEHIYMRSVGRPYRLLATLLRVAHPQLVVPEREAAITEP